MHCTALASLGYLDSGEGLNDSDEVLFQQVVVQLGQVRVDDWIVPQLCSVLCERLQQTTVQHMSDQCAAPSCYTATAAAAAS